MGVEFTDEDLVAKAVDTKGDQTLKDVKGEIKISTDEGEPKEVTTFINEGEKAEIYINEEDKEEFGDRPVKVEMDFDGFEKYEEDTRLREAQVKEKLPLKMKPKRFSKEMKREVLREIWDDLIVTKRDRLGG